jgi:hypothetical protein|tara:strand:+ start:1269 stop:1445 length:177 start_codon:yes stop_codon:yes gene_type:complete
MSHSTLDILDNRIKFYRATADHHTANGEFAAADRVLIKLVTLSQFRNELEFIRTVVEA